MKTPMRIRLEGILASRTRKEGDCLRYTGFTRGGYARFWADGNSQQLTRYIVREFHGDFPKDWHVDHVAARLCRFSDCINPYHLEAVPEHVNYRRKQAAARAGRLLTSMARERGWLAADEK